MAKGLRQYIVTSLAWYAAACGFSADRPRIMFGLYHSDGSCYGEMLMQWQDILSTNLSAQLLCYAGSFKQLSELSDVIAELGKLDDAALTAEKFIDILNLCGFEDVTEYKQP